MKHRIARAPLKSIVLGMLVYLGAGVASPVFSEERQQDKSRLVCTKAGSKVIFRSTEPMIEKFTSVHKGYTLVETTQVPAHKIIIYRFEPDDISCVADQR